MEPNAVRWCGPCKMMSETLAEIGPKMKDEMRIFKVIIDGISNDTLCPKGVG